jgi:Uma2 family endonuclease
MKFFEGAPVFAAEVRSEGDYGPAAEIEMAAKRADYFAAGTLVVWDVDLLGDDVVRVYRSTAPGTPTVYRRGDTAEAEPAVPGWRMPVDDLFPAD